MLTNTVCKVQQFQKVAPQVFRPLSYYKENIHFLKLFCNTLILAILNIFNSAKPLLKINTVMLYYTS